MVACRSEENCDAEPGKVADGLESFLKGLNSETVEFNLGDEINQMLKKYRAIKAKLTEQDEEVILKFFTYKSKELILKLVLLSYNKL